MRYLVPFLIAISISSVALADSNLCYDKIPRLDMRKIYVMGVRNPTWYCDRMMTMKGVSPWSDKKRLRRRKAVQNGSIWIGRIAVMFLLPVPTWPGACAIPTSDGRWAVYLHERHVDGFRLKNPRSWIPRHELAHVACDRRMWK